MMVADTSPAAPAKRVRDRRKPVAMHPFTPSNPDFVYFRDKDGACRPKPPPTPSPEPVAVLRYLLELDRLSRGRDGYAYNPRVTFSAEYRELMEAAVAAASGDQNGAG